MRRVKMTDFFKKGCHFYSFVISERKESNVMNRETPPKSFRDFIRRGGLPDLNSYLEDKEEKDFYEDLQNKSEEKYQSVIEALGHILDPELGVDLINLGLIYGVFVKKEDAAFVKVRMTLTTPACPQIDELIDQMLRALNSLEWISETKVVITFDPSWTPDRMSLYAKIALGFA